MKYILSFLFSLAAVIVCVYSFNANWVGFPDIPSIEYTSTIVPIA